MSNPSSSQTPAPRGEEVDLEPWFLVFHDERGVLICMGVPRSCVESEISKALENGAAAITIMADKNKG